MYNFIIFANNKIEVKMENTKNKKEFDEVSDKNSEKNDRELLNEAYKNVRMASFAIDCLIDKIENKSLESLLRKQNKFYLKTVTEIEVLSQKMQFELKDINIFLKGSSFVSIKMKTLMNNDSPKFAEMLVQGTTMGITDTLKAKSEFESNNEDVINIVDEIVSHEEEFVDSLKQYL